MSDLQPGPELDAAVAKAMGREPFTRTLSGVRVVAVDGAGAAEINPYNPSTNVALALEELNACKFIYWQLERQPQESGPDHMWIKTLMHGGYSEISEAHAICLVILAAKQETSDDSGTGGGA